jgi:crossover junction endodeoxyribonuclease RuvC
MEKAEIQLVIGLDLSLTSTGIAVYNIIDDNIFTLAVSTSSKDIYMARYSKILKVIKDIDHFLLPVSLFFIEGYSLGSFGKSSAMSNLIELGGIIKYDLASRGRSYISVPPTTLKKFITGKGNSKKEDIKLALYKKYGQEFKTSDEADAFSLAIMGIKYLNISSKYFSATSSLEKDCINKINKEGLM